jgi:hypothetical protein
MFIESKTYGQVLEHSPKGETKELIENPILPAFPAEECSIAHATSANLPTVDHENASPWRFTFINGATIELHDLRSSHNYGNLQTYRNKLGKAPKVQKVVKASKREYYGKAWSPDSASKKKQPAGMSPEGEATDGLRDCMDKAEQLFTNGNPRHIGRVCYILVSSCARASRLFDRIF